MDIDTLKKTWLLQVVEATDNLEYIGLNKFDLGPWSYSKVKSLEKCPFQFYLKYVVKVKLPKAVLDSIDTSMANIGSAAHKILEELVFGKSISDSYKESKKQYQVHGKLTEEQWKNSIEPLETNILNFKERLEALERVHPFKRTLTELRIGVTKDWEPAGFFGEDVFFRGVIDLTIQLQNGHAIFVDHKHGGGQGPITPYNNQLRSYKPLFHYGVEHIEGAKSAVHFIKEGDVKMGEFHTREEIEKDLTTGIVYSIESAVDRVKDLGYFKHIRGGYCKWCEYNDMCQPKELLPVELSTKKFFEIKSIEV